MTIAEALRKARTNGCYLVAVCRMQGMRVICQIVESRFPKSRFPEVEDSFHKSISTLEADAGTAEPVTDEPLPELKDGELDASEYIDVRNLLEEAQKSERWLIAVFRLQKQDVFCEASTNDFPVGKLQEAEAALIRELDRRSE